MTGGSGANGGKPDHRRPQRAGLSVALAPQLESLLLSKSTLRGVSTRSCRACSSGELDLQARPAKVPGRPVGLFMGEQLAFDGFANFSVPGRDQAPRARSREAVRTTVL